MGEASRQQREWNRETMFTPNLSLDIDKYPRDLLRGFIMSEHDGGRVVHGGGETDSEDESTIELNLGLSLGGRFGIDKTLRRLKRSSSVLGTVPFNDLATVAAETEAEPENYTMGLSRTMSLPAEMEEEWRKRKEMQSLRRMEAKRRRCEKQSIKVGNSNNQTVSFAASKSGFLQRHLVSSSRQVCIDSDEGGKGGGGGSGGSSSSLTEMDNKNQLGSSNSCGDERSPKIMTRYSSNSGSQGTEKPNLVRANKTNENEIENRVRREDSEDKKGKGMDTAAGLFDMPCVFTKGDGPNGRRVDGILYKYGKGDEVRIMCICHGSFLTPAEFVKHGGGVDVDRPLRHIVVNTSSSTF